MDASNIIYINAVSLEDTLIIIMIMMIVIRVIAICAAVQGINTSPVKYLHSCCCC